MSIHFPHKVVQFSSSYIPTCDAMILKKREEYVNIVPSHKMKVPTSMPLQIGLSAQQGFPPLQHMDKNDDGRYQKQNDCKILSSRYVFSQYETIEGISTTS